MRIEDIIEIYNQYIEDIRKSLNINDKSFLVIRKYIKSSEQFKIYKTAKIEVIIVSNENKYMLLNNEFTDRILSSQEIDIMTNLEKQVIKTLFSINNTDLFNKVIKGEYNENIIRD